MVRRRPAIEAAFSSAVRVTLVGSMTPALTRSSKTPVSGVVAVVLILGFEDFGYDDSAFFAGIGDDLTQWLFEGAAHDLRADLLVAFERLDEGVDRRNGANQGHAAAGDDAFLDCRAGCVQSVLNASLLLLQFGLGCSAHLDDGNATHQLGQPLLELLLVVVRGGLLNL